MTEFFVRSYPLEDIQIVKGGDGRTVEAYAAVFNRSAEIRDQDGHYLEDIHSGAFNRTIQNRGNRFGVFYNHGLTIHGTPSDRGSVPIGTPVEVRVDNVGVRTVTHYNRTDLADEVLDAIKSGAITAQSFTGRFLKSNPVRVPRRNKAGGLPTVTRMEIDMREYGPTPFPAYAEAMITGVRAAITGHPRRSPDREDFWDGIDLGRDPLRSLEEELLHFMAHRAGISGEALQDFMSSRGVDVPESRVTLPADELSGSVGADTPSGDSSRQDTPPPADPSAGDPADKIGHSARLRIARAARKMKLEAITHADSEAVSGS